MDFKQTSDFFRLWSKFLEFFAMKIRSSVCIKISRFELRSLTISGCTRYYRVDIIKTYKLYIIPEVQIRLIVIINCD